jgi:signal transduction histidine kinase
MRMKGAASLPALTNDDPDQLEGLRTARARLVAAELGLRRGVERRLHDDVQQQLAALGVKLQLARQLADPGPAELHAALEELREDVHDALDAVRRLAWEIYPALLLDGGLTQALRAVATRVDDDGITRYPRDVEAAVYFSCSAVLERIPATRVAIQLQEDADALRFDIRADGEELEPLPSIADRVAAVGGETTFTPGSIVGVIPLRRGTE